jgi:hypothetical protein
MSDHPLAELEASAEVWMRQGAKIFQKFTCDACGDRVTIMEENRLFTHGRHDECPVQDGYITDLRIKGCNYMVMQATGPFAFDGETQQR